MEQNVCPRNERLCGWRSGGLTSRCLYLLVSVFYRSAIFSPACLVRSPRPLHHADQGSTDPLREGIMALHPVIFSGEWASLSEELRRLSWALPTWFVPVWIWPVVRLP